MNGNREPMFIPSVLAKIISYSVFISWTVITVLPLFWMAYSSLKSNGELTRSIYAWPKDLFDNKNDEYVVITPDLNTIPDYNTSRDKRERIVIESTSIAPSRRLMVHWLVKSEMPPDIQSRRVGDKVYVNELPPKWQRRINRKTMAFNYTSAWIRGGMGRKFLNSIIYTAGSTFAILILGFMISFAISKLPFKRLGGIVKGIIGLGYLISINSIIIPLFLMLTSVGLTDTHLGIMMVYTAFGLPMTVLLGSQFMNSLPNSLIESARMDGAGYRQVFLWIILPMCIPVAVVVSIISGLGIWNEFLLVLVFASSEATKSLPVGVYSFSSLTGTQLGWQLAALVIATIPVVTIYLIFNRQLTRGVVAGAVKG